MRSIPSPLPSVAKEVRSAKNSQGPFTSTTGAIAALVPLLRLYEALSRERLGNLDNFTIVKFGYELFKVSYLFYPEFDLDPHPELHASLQVELATGPSQLSRLPNLGQSPPSSTAKKPSSPPTIPTAKPSPNSTHQEELFGLLDNPKNIGTRSNWERCLQDAGVEIQDHQVVRRQDAPKTVLDSQNRTSPGGPRIAKNSPVPRALPWKRIYLSPKTTFFDYGCGHGGDVRRIASQKFKSAGWDPYYAPDVPLRGGRISSIWAT